MYHIKTTCHPSGRYTCMQHHENASMWEDLPGKLFGNPDRADFYSAVGHYVEKLRSAERLASFTDAASALDE